MPLSFAQFIITRIDISLLLKNDLPELVSSFSNPAFQHIHQNASWVKAVAWYLEVAMSPLFETQTLQLWNPTHHTFLKHNSTQSIDYFVSKYCSNLTHGSTQPMSYIIVLWITLFGMLWMIMFERSYEILITQLRCDA